MNYITLPNMGAPVSVFAVCQAHAQLESDYNRGGILWERPSNWRRNAGTGVQLQRMGYRDAFWWVDIEDESDTDDLDDEDVRDIYILNVLNWKLPIDGRLAGVIERRYSPEWLEGHYPNWREAARDSVTQGV